MRPAVAQSLIALVLASTAAEARPQTIFYGVEPNDTKSQATLAFGIRAGDQLGAVGYSLTERNIFRLQHAPAPLGIYRHGLEVVGPPPPCEAHLLGRDAELDFVHPRSDTRLQSMGSAMPGSFLSWYGFGKSEELFVDLRVSTIGRLPGYFSPRLVTTPVTPLDLGAVAGPSLWFSAQSLGGLRDLELHLFDAELNALPRGSIDQSLHHPTDPRLHFNVAPGVYYIAVADHPAASHLPAGPEDLRLVTRVLDFAGAFIGGGAPTAFDVEVLIRSDPSAPPQASAIAMLNLPYEVLWCRVQVDAGQATASFCQGDGSSGTCACFGAAPSNSGMGCVNTTGRGATAIATDHSVAPGPRPWRITLEDLPSATVALAVLTLQTNAATPVLAGLSCIGPGAVRVGPWQADLAGTATFDGYLPSSSGFLVGQTVHMQAVYRDFFAPGGCQLNFTSGVSFVVR
jgi:hypothetical protein